MRKLKLPSFVKFRCASDNYSQISVIKYTISHSPRDSWCSGLESRVINNKEGMGGSVIYSDTSLTGTTQVVVIAYARKIN